jgi:hypothetical protein
MAAGCFWVRPAKLRARRFLEAFMVRQADGTTGETTSHLTKAASCQVIGYSHSTKPASGQVAGYRHERIFYYHERIF